MRCLILVSLLLIGCGDSNNPFHPDNAGQFCDVRGGVQLIEGGFIYCNDGAFIEEDNL